MITEKCYVIRTTYPNGNVSFEGKGLHRISPGDAWDVREFSYRSLSGAKSGVRSIDRLRKKWGLTDAIKTEILSTTLIDMEG